LFYIFFMLLSIGTMFAIYDNAARHPPDPLAIPNSLHIRLSTSMACSPNMRVRIAVPLHRQIGSDGFAASPQQMDKYGGQKSASQGRVGLTCVK
jgi:hypothetical protein